MNFENIPSLISSGFCEPVSIANLRLDNCKSIAAVPGVYFVLYASASPRPIFLPESIGGHFKGRNPTVLEAILHENWVENALVVYIGKATSLRTRIRTYLNYGAGKPVGHQGGRCIWQLTESANLLVTWKPTPEEDPEAVEQSLIREFRVKYGKRPFANLKD
jgi:hypothetical protein